jgi:hypothetical protein
MTDLSWYYRKIFSCRLRGDWHGISSLGRLICSPDLTMTLAIIRSVEERVLLAEEEGPGPSRASA